jgi:hypothetical protein
MPRVGATLRLHGESLLGTACTAAISYLKHLAEQQYAFSWHPLCSGPAREHQKASMKLGTRKAKECTASGPFFPHRVPDADILCSRSCSFHHAL